MKIPDDMNDKEMASRMNAKAVVSVRDMLLFLGASDEVLQECDERREILKNEPCRDKTYFEVTTELPNGMKCGFVRGKVDWSGTKFEE